MPANKCLYSTESTQLFYLDGPLYDTDRKCILMPNTQLEALPKSPTNVPRFSRRLSKTFKNKKISNSDSIFELEKRNRDLWICGQFDWQLLGTWMSGMSYRTKKCFFKGCVSCNK